MAETLPEAKFVGIDLSQRQILAGQHLIDTAGLKNVALEQKSVLELDRDMGTFDYIIAHGLYSWVPGEVQQKILELCRDLLSPNGIAYISYNTYPGWHLQGMLRDLLLYRTRKFADPHMRIRQSRLLLDKLTESFKKANNVYASMLVAHVEVRRNCTTRSCSTIIWKPKTNRCISTSSTIARRRSNYNSLVKPSWAICTRAA